MTCLHSTTFIWLAVVQKDHDLMKSWWVWYKPILHFEGPSSTHRQNVYDIEPYYIWLAVRQTTFLEGNYRSENLNDNNFKKYLRKIILCTIAKWDRSEKFMNSWKFFKSYNTGQTLRNRITREDNTKLFYETFMGCIGNNKNWSGKYSFIHLFYLILFL